MSSFSWISVARNLFGSCGICSCFSQASFLCTRDKILGNLGVSPWDNEKGKEKRAMELIVDLDGRNRDIVIAESLARVIAAIRIASVRWWSYLPREHRSQSSQTLRSLCSDSDRVIGVHSFNIRLAGQNYLPRPWRFNFWPVSRRLW